MCDDNVVFQQLFYLFKITERDSWYEIIFSPLLIKDLLIINSCFAESFQYSYIYFSLFKHIPSAHFTVVCTLFSVMLAEG